MLDRNKKICLMNINNKYIFAAYGLQKYFKLICITIMCLINMNKNISLLHMGENIFLLHMDDRNI